MRAHKGETMERYSMAEIASLAMSRTLDGEWVRWKDHKGLQDENRCLKDETLKAKQDLASCNTINKGLNNRIRRLETKTMQTYDEYDEYIEAQRDSEDVLKVKDVTECNCEAVAPLMKKGAWWICPKHGYKKR